MTLRFGSVRGPTSMGVKRSLLVLAGRSCIDNSPSSPGCERHDTSYCGDAASQGEIESGRRWSPRCVGATTSAEKLGVDRRPGVESRQTRCCRLVDSLLKSVMHHVGSRDRRNDLTRSYDRTRVVRDIEFEGSMPWPIPLLEVRRYATYLCPAASRISAAIVSGCEMRERWLAFTSIVFAPMRFAMKRWRSGLIVRSSVETA